jgi:hypothetical protein
MSSTTTPTTFSDLVTALLNRMRSQTGVTATTEIAKSFLNTALQDIHLGTQYKLPWAERSGVLRTQNDYSTGTVTITQGSTTLTGASTLWNTANVFAVNNVRAGGKIVIEGGVDVYEVSSVASDTSLTLTQRYVGSDVSAGTYLYFEDEYDLHADFLRPVDFNYFDSNRQVVLTNRSEFRRRHVRNATVGKITEAMVVDRAFSGSTTPRRRVVFHRPPDDFYLLPYNFITNKLAVSSAGTEQTQMSADADEPVIPLYCRHVLLAHAAWSWYLHLKNDTRAEGAAQEYIALMQRITSDSEVGAPRPEMQPRTAMYKYAAQRPYRTGRRGRFTTGTAWDELRD